MVLIGNQHQSVLAGLRADWADVQAASRPRFVHIVAESGLGKTAVVHAFYEELAGTQQGSPYWPPTIPHAVGTDAPLSDRLRRQRKAVVPAALADGQAPEFIWLGACMDEHTPGAGGVPVDRGLTDVIDQLSVHLVAYARRRHRRAVAFDAVKFTALFGFSMIPMAATVSMIPSLAEAAGQAVRVAKAFRPDGNAVRDERIRVFQRKLAEAWGAMGKTAPPAVLVLEDAHEMGAETQEMVDEILSQNLPFLIIALAHPVDGSRSSALAKLAGERGSTYTLDAMSTEDMVELVEALYPGTSRSVSEALAERVSGNPYGLQMSVLAAAVATPGQPVDLDPREVAELPATVDEALLARWHQLPEDQKRLLKVLAIIGFRSHHRVDVSALDSLGMVEPPGHQLSRWIRDVGDVRQFLELRHLEAVDRYGYLPQRDVRRLVVAALREAVRLADNNPGDELLFAVQIALLKNALSRHPPDLPEGLDAGGLALKLVRRARVANRDHDREVAAELVDLSMRLQAASGGGDATWQVESLLARSLIKVPGGPDEATRLGYVEEALAVAERSGDIPLQAIALGRLASALRGQVDGARLAEGFAAYQRMAALSATPGLKLTGEHNYAVLSAGYPWPLRTGDVAESFRLATEAALVAESLFSPADQRTSSALTGASYYALRMDPRLGLQWRRRLYARARELYGATHWRTAFQGKELAFTLALLEVPGAEAEAVQLAEVAVADQIARNRLRDGQPSKAKSTLIRTLLRQASVARQTGDAAGAESLEARCGQLEASLPNLAPQLVIASRWMARAAVGDESAGEGMERRLAHRQRTLMQGGICPDPENNPILLPDWLSLHWIYQRVGRHDDADALWESRQLHRWRLPPAAWNAVANE